MTPATYLRSLFQFLAHEKLNTWGYPDEISKSEFYLFMTVNKIFFLLLAFKMALTIVTVLFSVLKVIGIIQNKF